MHLLTTFVEHGIINEPMIFIYLFHLFIPLIPKYYNRYVNIAWKKYMEYNSIRTLI